MSVTENDRAVVGREIEMAEPETLVDEGQEQRHFAAPFGGRFEIERRCQLQRLRVRLPVEGDVIVAPRARDADVQLIVAGAIERPVLRADNLLDEVDGVGRGHVMETRDQSHRSDSPS